MNSYGTTTVLAEYTSSVTMDIENKTGYSFYPMYNFFIRK